MRERPYNLIYEDLGGNTIKLRRIKGAHKYETECGHILNGPWVTANLCFIRIIPRESLISNYKRIRTPAGFKVMVHVNDPKYADYH